MKKIKGLFIVPLFIATQFIQKASAQELSIYDRVSMQPLELAEVTAPEKMVLFANEKGKVDITPLGKVQEIYIRHIGYNTITTTLENLAKDNYKIYMRPSANTLDEIVISPTKFKEKLVDVPQKIELIKASDIAFMNQGNTGDMLANSGQVFVQKSQMGGGSPVIRGFEASRVLMVVDGIRLNNAIYRAGHLQNVITIDNNILDKTEIMYGPGSVTYGSDALGGVMHFYTKNPLLSKTDKTLVKANAAARFGTAAGEKMSHLDLNFGKKKVASLTSITITSYNDLRTGANRDSLYGDWGKKTFYVDRINNVDTVIGNKNVNVQSPSGYTQFDFLQKVLYQPKANVKHLLNFQFSNSTFIPRYDRLTQVRNNLPRFAEWYYGPQKRLLAAYTFDIKLKRKFADDFKVTAAYQDIEESRHNRSFRSDILASRIEKVGIVTLNADFEKRIQKHEFSYGFDGGYNRVNSTAFSNNIVNNETAKIDTRYPDGGSDWTYAALFVTHKLEPNKKWVISDGLRASYYQLKSVFNDKTFFPFNYNTVNQKNRAVNGNIGAVYKPNRLWKFGSVLSSGYRAPNVDDLSKVFESLAGNVIVPNPNLKPEFTYNADINISRTFLDQSFVALNGFYTYYTNAITTQASTINGSDSTLYDNTMSKVFTTTNTGKAYIYGMSIKVVLELTDNFRLINDFSYTYGRIVTDSTPYPLDHIPPTYGRISLQYTQKKLKAELFVLYNGWKKVKDYNMFGEDNFTSATKDGTPAWSTLNLRMGYQITKGLQIQAGIENIFDRHYRYFASGLSAAGRNIFFTLRGSI
jgi:hemoglobin/transferrin/lactoferrin receptor protein